LLLANLSKLFNVVAFVVKVGVSSIITLSSHATHLASIDKNIGRPPTTRAIIHWNHTILTIELQQDKTGDYFIENINFVLVQWSSISASLASHLIFFININIQVNLIIFRLIQWTLKLIIMKTFNYPEVYKTRTSDF